MSGDDDVLRSCLDKSFTFIGVGVNLAWLCVSLALPCSASSLLVISSCCGAVIGCITLALQLALPLRIVNHTYFRIVMFIIALPFLIFGCCIAFPLYPIIDTIDCHPVIFYFAFVNYCSVIVTLALSLVIYTPIYFSRRR
jgi:hypothetical protein